MLGRGRGGIFVKRWKICTALGTLNCNEMWKTLTENLSQGSLSPFLYTRLCLSVPFKNVRIIMQCSCCVLIPI